MYEIISTVPLHRVHNAQGPFWRITIIYRDEQGYERRKDFSHVRDVSCQEMAIAWVEANKRRSLAEISRSHVLFVSYSLPLNATAFCDTGEVDPAFVEVRNLA